MNGPGILNSPGWVTEQMEVPQIKKENSEENRVRDKDDEFNVGHKEGEAHGACEASRGLSCR